MNVRRLTLLFLLSAMSFTLTGCDTQATKEKSADTTEQLKQDSKEAAAKTKEGMKEAGKDLKAMAQGVKEGWTQDKNALDLNTASAPQLTGLGLSEKQASRIIANRPYKMRHELVTKGVLSEQEYKDIEAKITAK